MSVRAAEARPRDVEARLRVLERLHNEHFVDDAEYEAKRKEMLKGL